jgi:SM-20-related protein
MTALQAFEARLPSIIDALATQGWVVVNDFLTSTITAGLLAEGKVRQAEGRFHRASVGRAQGQAVRDEIRGDHVLWLDPAQPSSAEACYWAQIEALQQALNEALYLGIREGEFHYAHYPVGAFYKRHIDRFRDDDARVVSTVCYLNENWQTGDGGQIRLWLEGNGEGPYEDILPQAGRLVLFMADRFWHEVLPATRERWSLTGWLRRAT